MKKIIAFTTLTLLLACSGSQHNEDTDNREDTKTATEENNTAESTVEEETTTLSTDIFYPADYRQWTHVKSLILEKGHPLFENFGGLHHIYANKEAMEGYRTGHFPDGSVIVFDLLEVTKQDNAIAEGNRKVIGVMYKNSGAFSETGGWIFGGFKDQSGEKLNIDWKAQCFSCHLSQKDKDYVFSTYRE